MPLGSHSSEQTLSRIRRAESAPLAFDAFIGIDWSGAKGTSQKGIAVAEATPGDCAPKITHPNGRRHWSRTGVVEWLREKAKADRILVGIDFAFAHPWHDLGNQGAYYKPNIKSPPNTPQELWAMIERICKYAGNYLAHPKVCEDSELREYYNLPQGNGKQQGELFSENKNRFRRTERAAESVARPCVTFNGHGQKGVACGSLAGWRVLHELQHDFAIWPFRNPRDGQSVIVEVYPSFLFGKARKGMWKPKNLKDVNLGLRHYKSQELTTPLSAERSGDKFDAIITAAAIRHLTRDPQVWGCPDEAKKEGWIFGVDPGRR